MKTKIYLVENCYEDPNKVYIGKTINCRKNNHQQTYGKNIIYSYIDEIDSLDYQDWKPLEIYWIEQFRQWGFEILNNNEGGGGPSKWSDELLNSKENQIRKEKIKNNKERANKISVKTKGIPLSDERKEKLRGPRPHLLGLKKKGWSEESKQNQSKKLKGREAIWFKNIPLSEEHKNKISNTKKGKPSGTKGIKRPYLKENPNSQKPVIQYSLDEIFIKEYPSATEAARQLGISNSVCISRCCNNKNKTAFGYKWKFKNKILL